MENVRRGRVVQLAGKIPVPGARTAGWNVLAHAHPAGGLTSERTGLTTVGRFHLVCRRTARMPTLQTLWDANHLRTAAGPRSGPLPEGPAPRARGGPRARRRPRTTMPPGQSTAARGRRARRAGRGARPAPRPACPPPPTRRPPRPLPWPRPSTGLSLWPFGISFYQRDPGVVAPGSFTVYTRCGGAIE